MWQIVDAKTREVLASGLLHQETFAAMRVQIRAGRKVERHWVEEG
jgi:hypothetical protein